jgi:hypothetical protein
MAEDSGDVIKKASRRAHTFLLVILYPYLIERFLLLLKIK